MLKVGWSTVVHRKSEFLKDMISLKKIKIKNKNLIEMHILILAVISCGSNERISSGRGKRNLTDMYSGKACTTSVDFPNLCTDNTFWETNQSEC